MIRSIKSGSLQRRVHTSSLQRSARLLCSHRWLVGWFERKLILPGATVGSFWADDGAKRDPSFHERVCICAPSLVAVEAFESRPIRLPDDEPIGAGPHLSQASSNGHHREREDFKSDLSSAVTAVARGFQRHTYSAIVVLTRSTTHGDHVLNPPSHLPRGFA